MNDQKLLTDIYENACTGIYSLDTLMSKVSDPSIMEAFRTQRQKMEAVSYKAQEMMRLRSIEIPNAPIMHQMGIWMGTQYNTLIDSTHSHLAEMVIQGDTMGITQMVGSLNDHPGADVDITGLGTELVNIQRRGIESLKKFL